MFKETGKTKDGRKVHTRRAKLAEVQTLILDNLQQLEKQNAASQKDGESWAGCTWEKSVEYLTKGWKAGVAKLDVTPTAAMHEAMRPKPLWDVAGSEVDVASYLAGVPECMSEMVRTRRPSQVVKIGVDRSISAAVPASRIESLGRNILMLVEGLRLGGVPAEVWACESVSGGMEVYDIGVCVQEPGRPVDVSVLAYWVAHPAALRRTIFALEELEPQHIRRTIGFGPEGGGYGFPLHDYSKPDYDEWAPSPQKPDSEIEAWVQDVLTRRVGR